MSSWLLQNNALRDYTIRIGDITFKTNENNKEIIWGELKHFMDKYKLSLIRT